VNATHTPAQYSMDIHQAAALRAKMEHWAGEIRRLETDPEQRTPKGRLRKAARVAIEGIRENTLPGIAAQLKGAPPERNTFANAYDLLTHDARVLATEGLAQKARFVEKAQRNPLDALEWAHKPAKAVAAGQLAQEYLLAADTALAAYGETGECLQVVYNALLTLRARVHEMLYTATRTEVAQNAYMVLVNQARQYARGVWLDRTEYVASMGQVTVDSVALYDGTLAE